MIPTGPPEGARDRSKPRASGDDPDVDGLRADLAT